MSSGSVLARSDWEEFLLSLYFGQRDDPLMSCVSRAYLDFSRTLHGMAELSVSDRDALVNGASAKVWEWLSSLRQGHIQPSSQAEFDDWHRKKCTSLTTVFQSYPRPVLHIGQAQKWLNMAFKYVYTFGEGRLPGFARLYPYCHVPLDNVVLDRLKELDAPVPDRPWSRWNDYSLYLELQLWIRNRFRVAPLDVEFALFLGRSLPEEGAEGVAATR